MLFLLSKYLCLGAYLQEEEKEGKEKKRGRRERREGMPPRIRACTQIRANTEGSANEQKRVLYIRYGVRDY